MSTGGAFKTIGGALFDGAGTALRLIILLRVGMQGSLLQAGAQHSQPPTPGRMAAASDVAKVVLIDRYYKVKG
jgi:hypothetical protein